MAKPPGSGGSGRQSSLSQGVARGLRVSFSGDGLPEAEAPSATNIKDQSPQSPQKNEKEPNADLRQDEGGHPPPSTSKPSQIKASQTSTPPPQTKDDLGTTATEIKADQSLKPPQNTVNEKSKPPVDKANRSSGSLETEADQPSKPPIIKADRSSGPLETEANQTSKPLQLKADQGAAEILTAAERPKPIESSIPGEASRAQRPSAVTTPLKPERQPRKPTTPTPVPKEVSLKRRRARQLMKARRRGAGTQTPDKEMRRATMAETIQRVWRGKVARRQLHTQWICACAIQAVFRGYLVRSKTGRLRDHLIKLEHDERQRIQRKRRIMAREEELKVLKMTPALSLLRMEDRRRHRAARRIQRHWRMIQGRKRAKGTKKTPKNTKYEELEKYGGKGQGLLAMPKAVWDIESEERTGPGAALRQRLQQHVNEEQQKLTDEEGWGRKGPKGLRLTDLQRRIQRSIMDQERARERRERFGQKNPADATGTRPKEGPSSGAGDSLYNRMGELMQRTASNSRMRPTSAASFRPSSMGTTMRSVLGDGGLQRKMSSTLASQLDQSHRRYLPQGKPVGGIRERYIQMMDARETALEMMLQREEEEELRELAFEERKVQVERFSKMLTQLSNPPAISQVWDYYEEKQKTGNKNSALLDWELPLEESNLDKAVISHRRTIQAFDISGKTQGKRKNWWVTHLPEDVGGPPVDIRKVIAPVPFDKYLGSSTARLKHNDVRVQPSDGRYDEEEASLWWYAYSRKGQTPIKEGVESDLLLERARMGPSMIRKLAERQVEKERDQISETASQIAAAARRHRRRKLAPELLKHLHQKPSLRVCTEAAIKIQTAWRCKMARQELGFRRAESRVVGALRLLVSELGQSELQKRGRQIGIPLEGESGLEALLRGPSSLSGMSALHGLVAAGGVRSQLQFQSDASASNYPLPRGNMDQTDSLSQLVQPSDRGRRPSEGSLSAMESPLFPLLRDPSSKQSLALSESSQMGYGKQSGDTMEIIMEDPSSDWRKEWNKNARTIQAVYRGYKSRSQRSALEIGPSPLPDNANDFQRLLHDIQEKQGSYATYLDGWTVATTYTELGLSTLKALSEARAVLSKVRMSLGSDSGFLGFLEGLANGEGSVKIEAIMAGLQAADDHLKIGFPSQQVGNQLLAAFKYMNLTNDGRLSIKELIQLVGCNEKDHKKAVRKVKGHILRQATPCGVTPQEYLKEGCAKVLQSINIQEELQTVCISPSQFREIVLGMGIQLSALELELCLQRISNENGQVQLEKFFSLALVQQNEDLEDVHPQGLEHQPTEGDLLENDK